MTKLSEVREGDILITDDGFTCMKNGEEKVVKRNQHSGDLYIECKNWRHNLDGQVSDNDNDTLIGLTKKEVSNG